MELEKLANILGVETIKKIYEDGISHPLQESSRALSDLIKAARLFTAPIQLLASYQDRLTKYLDKVRESVPEDRQIEAPPSLSGPVLEKLKYLDENNYLTDLYLELLKRAIDKERVSEAHPAFFSLIEQISPDEALVLYYLNESPLDLQHSRDLNKEKQQFEPIVPIGSLDLINKLIFPNHFFTYIEHLKSLGLIYWKRIKDDDIIWNDPKTQKDQKGVICNDIATITHFGEMFVKACIPNAIILLKT